MNGFASLSARSTAALVSQGLLLGLASGLVCLATCAPVLLPLFLGKTGSVRRHGVLLAEFLAGRLAGYLGFAVVAWAAGWLESGVFPDATWLHGAVMCLLGLTMLMYGLPRALRRTSSQPKSDSCALSPWHIGARLRNHPALTPAAIGLLTGLNLCPPFYVALVQGAASGSFVGSLLFFAAFFLGTTVYLLPTPWLGVLGNRGALAQVGNFAAVLVAAYYLCSGGLALVGGLSPS